MDLTRVWFLPGPRATYDSQEAPNLSSKYDIVDQIVCEPQEIRVLPSEERNQERIVKRYSTLQGR